MSMTTTQPPEPETGAVENELRSGTLPNRFPAVLLVSCGMVVAGVLAAFSSFGIVLWALLTGVAYTVIMVTASIRLEGGRKAKDRLVTALVYSAFLLAMAPLVSLLYTVVTFGIVLWALLTGVAYTVIIVTASARMEGGRKAKDRLVTALVYSAFLLAMAPLVSLLYTVVTFGLDRFGWNFLTVSMNGVLPSMDAGGAYHAIIGTLMITGMATLMSVPIGVLTAVYLVEYAQGRLKKVITFFVDVMTGIPSIVAGLFVVALWMMIFGPGNTNGAAGAISLAVLMIPVVVRSSEEMLRLVPRDLREASYALGVPKWRTITKVVLPTSAAGLTTGIMLAIARVIGETAPLVLTTGSSAVSINWNLFDGQMMNLPVFIFSQFRMGGTVNYERAWAAALTLVLTVMLLFLMARVIGRLFSPKTR